MIAIFIEHCRRHRFKILLGMLVLLLVVSPGIELLHTTSLTRGVLNLSITLMLLSAAFAVSSSRVRTIIAAVLVAPVVIFQIVDVIVPAEGASMAEAVIAVIAVTYIITLVVEYLFRTDEISADTLAASVCIYLLLGVLWAWAYSFVAVVWPGSFNFAFPGEDSTLRFGGDGSAYALYYSFVTMTTLGYGDIAPASAPARTLAVMQAIVGQIYLTVLVARLVGLQIARRVAKD
jgi:hypothetical protein